MNTTSDAPRVEEDPTQGTARRQRAIGEFVQLDQAVYSAIADTPTPTLDEPFRVLSNAANHSKLWVGFAALIAASGGMRGRQAATVGLASIGVTSLIVNQGLKRLAPRTRPDRAGEDVSEERYVRMPGSTSFPSGHSASAFAFAAGVAGFMPALSTPLNFLAASVAYSRVHTGVHYPGDVIVGSIVGAGIGRIVSSVAKHRLG